MNNPKKQLFIDPLRALAIIEGLCMMHDLEDLENPTHTDQFISQLYMIAHSASYGSCHEVHENWREDALKAEKELVDANIMSAWGEPEKMMELPF